MERESFEDLEVAAVLNDQYVAIKVDREERPDIDHIYMTVCQATTGQGGWPLTILMTPDQKPFFAGTYFPKESRYGRHGLLSILTRVAEQWTADRARIEDAGAHIVRELTPHMSPSGRTPADAPDADTLRRLMADAVDGFLSDFDPAHGGFGGAPKFPMPHNLLFLLRHGYRHGSASILPVVERTLDAMRRGGIYDHVGFGFARYATDKQWLVPHFEKMLYDNALLILAYVEAYQVTGTAMYAQVATDIITYVLRNMTDAEGGFYSAEDADSEGEEGLFYLWTPQEVKEVLGETDGQTYCRYYQITDDGNFEGRSIIHLIGQDEAAFAASEGETVETWTQRVRGWNERLFRQREARVHPHKDDKVLTSWNGLMIAALAVSGKVLDQPSFVKASRRAAQFILTRMTTGEGRLLARYRDGDAAHLGYVDDYAFFIWGLLELYEATFEPAWLAHAARLQKSMVDLFWDASDGGFFFYGHDAESLIARPTEIYDGATPSGNSVALLNLVRLARITGDTAYEKTGDALIRRFYADVERHPPGYAFFLMGLQFAVDATREIVIAGRPDDPETQTWLAAVQQLYLPDSVVVFHPDGETGESIRALADYVRGQPAVDGRPTAYICENFACQAPLHDIDAMRSALRSR